MALIGPLTPYNLLENQALTVSGGATPSATSNPLPTGMLSKLHVYVANSGASTSVTVNIYGKKTATATIKEHLATFTLGAATGSGASLVPYSAGRYIESSAIPSFIYAVATNSDAANTASVTISLDRWR
jgi:hypothetical protein